jgi:hypothetical protein
MKQFALTPDQISEMQKLLETGYTPLDISRYFEIGITSVHNYKNRLKEKGIVLPSVKGKRPQGLVPLKDDELVTGKTIKVYINGVMFSVTGKPKSVIITEDNLEVTY